MGYSLMEMTKEYQKSCSGKSVPMFEFNYRRQNYTTMNMTTITLVVLSIKVFKEKFYFFSCRVNFELLNFKILNNPLADAFTCFRSCNGRDRLGPLKMSDSTWLTSEFHNPLAVGQYVNNCSNGKLAP